MTQMKKTEQLDDHDLDQVTGGANETPIAANRFSISIDGSSIGESGGSGIPILTSNLKNNVDDAANSGAGSKSWGDPHEN